MLLLSCDDIEWPDFIGFHQAMDCLRSGRDPLGAVEARVCAVENAGLNSIGVTGLPDAEGHVTLDAGIMSGSNYLSAGIGCLSGFQNPFKVVRELWRRQLNNTCPHNFLVGQGADKFATSMNAETASNNGQKASKIVAHDTVGCIAWGGGDQWFVGTSTSGWGGKAPGRLGDSCAVGAGFYACPKGAVFCTWTGEVATRFALSARVITYLEKGLPPGQAVGEVLEFVASMKEGYRGPIIIYAAGSEKCSVAGYGYKEAHVPATYTFWRDGMNGPERRRVPFWEPGTIAPEF